MDQNEDPTIGELMARDPHVQRFEREFEAAPNKLEFLQQWDADQEPMGSLDDALDKPDQEVPGILLVSITMTFATKLAAYYGRPGVALKRSEVLAWLKINRANLS